MMKRNLIAILMMTAALASGCGAKASDTTTTAATQAETTGGSKPDRDNTGCISGSRSKNGSDYRKD